MESLKIHGEKVPEMYKGLKVERIKDVEGRERQRVIFEPGKAYLVAVEFRRFGVHESDWHSTSSDDVEQQKEPFIFDVTTPEVRGFSDTLFDALTTTPNDVHFVKEFDAQFTRMLPSAPSEDFESYSKLSDIVRAGKATCAAKVTLAGALLSHKFPSLRINEIHGQRGIVEEKITKPYGHVWMRIESENCITLYDPMYSEVLAIQKGQPLPIEETKETIKFFSESGVAILAAGPVYEGVPDAGFDPDLVFVKEYRGDTYRVFHLGNHSLTSQIYGSYEFVFLSEKGGLVELCDDNFTLSKGNTSEYYPVVKIEETELQD